MTENEGISIKTTIYFSNLEHIASCSEIKANNSQMPPLTRILLEPVYRNGTASSPNIDSWTENAVKIT